MIGIDAETGAAAQVLVPRRAVRRCMISVQSIGELYAAFALPFATGSDRVEFAVSRRRALVPADAEAPLRGDEALWDG